MQKSAHEELSPPETSLHTHHLITVKAGCVADSVPGALSP